MCHVQTYVHNQVDTRTFTHLCDCTLKVYTFITYMPSWYIYIHTRNVYIYAYYEYVDVWMCHHIQKSWGSKADSSVDHSCHTYSLHESCHMMFEWLVSESNMNGLCQTYTYCHLWHDAFTCDMTHAHCKCIQDGRFPRHLLVSHSHAWHDS